jgi:hypothetical protein
MLVFLFVLPVVALADIFGGDKAHPVTYAWYDDSVSAYGYTPHYDAGREYWNGITDYAHVYSNKGDYVDGHDKYYIGHSNPDPDVVGQMTPFYITWYGEHLEAWDNDDWDYCVVTMYHENMEYILSYSAGTVKYNAAHEIGHSLKLAHPTHDANTVLEQGFNQSLPPSPYNQDVYELRCI